MTAPDLPTTDEEIKNMLADDRHVPLAAVSYVNWHNAYSTLTDDLKRAFREAGTAGLRDYTLLVAENVVENALDKAGMDREPTPDEVLATAVRVVAVPDTTRDAFVRGAVAEILWENHLAEMGHEVLDAEAVKRETGVSVRKQEEKGWDVTVKNGDGTLTHFQIKATASRPSPSAKKDADVLIWYESDDDGALLTPEEI